MLIQKPFDPNVEMVEYPGAHGPGGGAAGHGPAYLSPTSLNMFWTDREEFFLQYIMKIGRAPATLPMMVGSAFDAYVKSFLGTHLFGAEKAASLGLELGSLLDRQVGDETAARLAGRSAFKLYVSCGALADLILRLESVTPGSISFDGDITDTICGVPFRGLPDMSWSGSDGSVVLDWKVNGWCSASRTSPKPGYRCVRPSGASHKKWGTIECFSSVDTGWARQLCIYGWLLGSPVGTPQRVMIDQICGQDRVAHHEGVVSAEFQLGVMQQATAAWEFIQRGVWPAAWVARGNVILSTAELGPMFR